MTWEFTFADLTEILLFLGALSTAYWKLSTRVSLLEADGHQRSAKISELDRDIKASESKLEHKLDTMADKIDTLLIEVTALKTKTG